MRSFLTAAVLVLTLVTPSYADPSAEKYSTLEHTGNQTATLTSQSTEGVLVEDSMCKLREDSFYRNQDAKSPMGFRGNATAFPFNPTALPITGTINVAFIYVDWTDLRGTKADYQYYKNQLKMFKDFYWMASENKLAMNTRISKSWFRIPGSYKDFTLTADQEAQYGAAPRKQSFYDAAVAASDSETDFSNVDIVFFGIPRSKSVFLHGGPHEFNWNNNGFLNTAEKKIFDTATAGDWFLKNPSFEPPWVYYVHETGHMIGIPHQSDERSKDGSIVERSMPMGGYDIMGNQGGATRTISTWLRWLAGWLGDDQVLCTTESNIKDETFQLYPINTVKGAIESLVIKLSDSSAVVVESRRFDRKFDRKTGNSRDGLLVYTVNAKEGSAEGNMRLLSPRNIRKYLFEPTWRSGYELDPVFFQGDEVIVGGLTIKAQKIGSKFDTVRVTRNGR